MIEKRVSELSSTKEIFDAEKGHYEEALAKSGYDHKLNYNPPKENSRRKNRQRKILWFNPPYSKNVKTKVAEEFLKLLDRHFPLRYRLRDLINRNNFKVSSSTI